MSLALRVLLVSLFAFSSFAQQVLEVHGTAGAADRGAGTLPVQIVVINRSDAPLTGVELLLSTRGFQVPIEVMDPAWACSEPSSFRQCVYSRAIEPHAEVALDVTLRFPGGLGRTLLEIQATYGTPGRKFGDLDEVDAVIARPFFVTRNEDAGAGTLRAAPISSKTALPTSTGAAQNYPFKLARMKRVRVRGLGGGMVRGDSATRGIARRLGVAPRLGAVHERGPTRLVIELKANGEAALARLRLLPPQGFYRGLLQELIVTSLPNVELR